MEDYHWEDFTMKSVPIATGPMVSIQKKGTFAINRDARALLGDYEAEIFVRLRYDRARRTIGLSVVDKDTPKAYPVRLQKSHGNTWIVAGAAFCKFFSIPTGQTRRYIAHAIDGPTLVVDLNNEVLPVRAPISPRARRNGRPEAK